MAETAPRAAWTNWQSLARAIEARRGNSREVLRRASIDGVPVEDVARALSRADASRAIDSVEDLPPFASGEAIAPGTIDLRVFDQTTWWVDVLARPHALTAMSTTYLQNVIEVLRERAATLCEAYHLKLRGTHVPADNEAWMESTPLMRSLRAELNSRPDAYRPEDSPSDREGM
jgi:hypothetical protein